MLIHNQLTNPMNSPIPLFNLVVIRTLMDISKVATVPFCIVSLALARCGHIIVLHSLQVVVSFAVFFFS